MSDRREMKADGEASEDERLLPIAKAKPPPKDRSVVQCILA